MNTTTATRRNALLAQQDIRIRLPAGAPPPFRDGPEHDFLVLNQRPDLTPEIFLPLAPAALLKT